MAALNEADLIKILGANYQASDGATQREKTPAEQERDLLARVESTDSQIFTAFALVAVGLALLGSTYYTATGIQYWIQGALGIAVLLGGIAFWLYLRNKLSNLRGQSGELRRQIESAAKA